MFGPHYLSTLKKMLQATLQPFCISEMILLAVWLLIIDRPPKNTSFLPIQKPTLCQNMFL